MIDPEKLCRLLRYDPKSKNVVWNERTYADYNTKRPEKDFTAHDKFNRELAHKPPSWRVSKYGYYFKLSGTFVTFDDVTDALDLTDSQAETLETSIQEIVAPKSPKEPVQKSAERLAMTVTIDEDTGKLVWLPRTEQNAPEKTQEWRDKFNAIWAGSTVATKRDEQGRKCVQVGGYRANAFTEDEAKSFLLALTDEK